MFWNIDLQPLQKVLGHEKQLSCKNFRNETMTSSEKFVALSHFAEFDDKGVKENKKEVCKKLFYVSQILQGTCKE